MAKNISLKDIAHKVGVSTATVSYVLNGLEKEKRIRPEIVINIHRAVKELNYKPNQVARSLRRGSTNSLGLVVSDISNPFFGQLAKVIEEEAALNNNTVIFGSSDNDCAKSKMVLETLQNRKVDGYIIVPSDNCTEQIKSILKGDVPVVLIDRYFPELNSNHIVLNNYDATYSAVEHFISNGYNNIAMIAYNSTLTHMQERIRGYKEAMLKNGLAGNITVRKVNYVNVKTEVDEKINELIESTNVDALIFATNNITISGLYSIRKNNIKVPEELAIIGFDGHEVYDFFQPPLTYIEQPIEEMGREAVKLLLDQKKGSKKIVQMQLNSKLIMRASSSKKIIQVVNRLNGL